MILIQIIQSFDDIRLVLSLCVWLLLLLFRQPCRHYSITITICTFSLRVFSLLYKFKLNFFSTYFFRFFLFGRYANGILFSLFLLISFLSILDLFVSTVFFSCFYLQQNSPKTEKKECNRFRWKRKLIDTI